MKLSDDRGIKTGQWYPNIIFRDGDINLVGEATYQNITDLYAVLYKAGLDTGRNIAISGVTLIWSNLLSTNLQEGAAISPQGAYLNSDVWGFVADPGGVFLAVVPEAQVVAFNAGGSNDRIDTVEIRPVETNYNSVSRNFKDPVTGIVSTAVVPTRKEYEYEFAVRKGNDAAALAVEQSDFTFLDAYAAFDGLYLTFETAFDSYYVWWDINNGSSDPAPTGRTGIEVNLTSVLHTTPTMVATKTEDDMLAAIASGLLLGAAVSRTTVVLSIDTTTYGNFTDATIGTVLISDLTVSVTNGNGAASQTAGWIKIAEVAVAASASAIDQDDINDWRDSDLWNTNAYGTVLQTVPAVDVSITDTADDFTSENVEDALAELVTKTAVDVPITDTAGEFISDNVEDALAELVSKESFTTGDAVTAGRAVVFDGTDIVHCPLFFDDFIRHIGGTTDVFYGADSSAVFAIGLDSTTFVVGYRRDVPDSDGYCRVGKINTYDEITFGTEAEVIGSIINDIRGAKIDSTHFAIVTNGTANDYAIIATVSGTILSYGSTYAFRSGDAGDIDVCVLDSTHIVVTYTVSTRGYAKVGVLSGSVIAFGSEYGSFDDGAGTTSVRCAALDSTHFVVAYSDGLSDTVQACVGEVSNGDEITFGTGVNATGTVNPTGVHVDRLTDTSFVMVWRDTADNDEDSIVGIVSNGTTITYGLVVEIYPSNVPARISVMALSPTKFVATWIRSTTQIMQRVGAVSSDDVIVYNNEVQTFVTADSSYQFTGKLSPSRLITAYTETTAAEGRVFVSTLRPKPHNGLALETKAVSQSCITQYAGVVTGLSGLTPGEYYEYSFDGELVPFSGDVIDELFLGQALSATELLISHGRNR